MIVSVADLAQVSALLKLSQKETANMLSTPINVSVAVLVQVNAR